MIDNSQFYENSQSFPMFSIIEQILFARITSVVSKSTVAFDFFLQWIDFSVTTKDKPNRNDIFHRVSLTFFVVTPVAVIHNEFFKATKHHCSLYRKHKKSILIKLVRIFSFNLKSKQAKDHQDHLYCDHLDGWFSSPGGG